jgi:hypothetical protein
MRKTFSSWSACEPGFRGRLPAKDSLRGVSYTYSVVIEATE